MKTKFLYLFTLLLIISLTFEFTNAYPIDGYASTHIRRLLRLQLILDGKIKENPPIKGQLKSISEIKLNLTGTLGDKLAIYPEVNKDFQKEIDRLFPNRDESYSITLLDITDPNNFRYAQRQSDRTFMPGSVGKLAILAGLFTELKTLYPESFEKRQKLMQERFVTAGKWAISNFHTVPTFIPETNVFYKRIVQEQDVFSLYEWVDHMISVSSNAAASIVWKELVLMILVEL